MVVWGEETGKYREFSCCQKWNRETALEGENGGQEREREEAARWAEAKAQWRL